MDGRENQPLLAEPVAAAMPMAMAVPVAAAPMAHDGGGGESKYGAAPIAVAVPVSQQGGKSVFDAMPSAPPMQGISDQYSAHDQVRTPLLQGPPPLCLSVSSHANQTVLYLSSPTNLTYTPYVSRRAQPSPPLC